MRKALHHTIASFVFLLHALAASAADVNLNGVLGNRALLVIDGGKPTWVSVGQVAPGGVKLVSISGDSAVIELGGKRETLMMGQGARVSAGARSSGAQSVILTADNQGHFFTAGAINGISVRFLIDTGATVVSMGSSDAKRLGINYTAGRVGYSNTAGGVVPIYRIRLDEVRIGDVTLTNVEGAVHADNSLPVVLLGMSFLNRMEMKREGEKMVLTKRF